MESRIIDLEIRLTHQEAVLNELSDALIHQQKVVDRLQAEVESLKERMQAVALSNITDISQEKPPPHY